MRRARATLFGSVVLAALIGGTLQARANLPQKLAVMTPADIGARTHVTDDPLERYVVISTDRAYRGNRPVEGGMEGKAHLRAIVDRTTNAARFEIWHETTYRGARKDLYQVNYLADGTLRETDLLVSVHEPDDCPMVDAIGTCILAKKVAFELPEAVVREIALRYEPRSRTPWVYRLKDRNGKDITSGIAPAEASGLLQALENWRRRP